LVGAAIAWALARVGAASYASRCLSFVEDAFERSNQIEIFGGATAAESAMLYGVQPYESDAPPPPGAFVFYAWRGAIDGVDGDWGHVGLSLGVGRLVHAWNVVRVDEVHAVTRLMSTAGTEAPRLIGWTPVDRILEGHRRRDWDDGAG
jgi:cell wall-associated NlpC family hydrolase